MHPPKIIVAILGALSLLSSAFAQEMSIALHDAETSTSDVKTIFKDKVYDVVLTGHPWSSDMLNAGWTSATYVTYVNGSFEATGKVIIDPYDVPSELPVGKIKVSSWGTKTVSVEWFFVADPNTADSGLSTASASRDYQAFSAGASLIPLAVILCLAICTGIVELSLTTGIFVGACMLAGNIKDGFKVSSTSLQT